MANLTFKMEHLKPIIEHARDAREHRPSYSELCEPSMLKDGETMPESGFAESHQIDNAKIPPALWFVHDDGIYLMSNGFPMQWREDEKRAVVAYAQGYDPQRGSDVWQKCRDAVGGDDFAESLPLKWFTDALAKGAHAVTLKVSANSIECVSRIRGKRTQEQTPAFGAQV